MEVQLQAALVTATAVVVGLVVQGLLTVRTLRQRRLADDREARCPSWPARQEDALDAARGATEPDDGQRDDGAGECAMTPQNAGDEKRRSAPWSVRSP